MIVDVKKYVMKNINSMQVVGVLKCCLIYYVIRKGLIIR